MNTFIYASCKDINGNREYLVAPTEEDIEGFVNYTLKVKGVRIGLLFYELVNGFKISFRSIGSIKVNKLANDFGGGGHPNAAGTRIPDEDMETYIDKVVKRAADYLN